MSSAADVFFCLTFETSSLHSLLGHYVICLGSWSLGEWVMYSDVLEVGTLADVAEDEEQELGEGWDNIQV